MGSDARGGATDRGVSGSICEIGAAAATCRVRLGAMGAGLIFVLGGVVIRAGCFAFALEAAVALVTEGLVVVRGTIEALTRALARGAALVAACFRRAAAATGDFARGLTEFFGLTFLLPALGDCARAFFLAGVFAAFAVAREVDFLVGADAARLGTRLAALRRTTGRRLLIVRGFQRERLGRNLRANRCLWRNRRNRRAFR